MIQADLFHPAELPPRDREAWLSLCAATPVFSSPLLGPDFAEAVGAVRPDARVAVFRQGGAVLGLLAFHLRPSGLARPIGSPFSDYHALITPPDPTLDGPGALAAAGLSAYRFSALLDPYGLFAEQTEAACKGWVMQLGEGGAAAYVEALRTDNPKRAKNYRRLENKLERELGPIELVGPDFDQDAYDLLLRWKRDQLRRTGKHDFLGPDWTRGLMQSLFERREGDFQGLMVTLRAGGRIVAGHFGVRLGETYHPWIASMDPDGGAWSPGQTLLAQAIRKMPELGLTAYDLAPSHDHYKQPFCTTTRAVAEGLALTGSADGRKMAACEEAWALAARGSGAVRRLRRRMDHIAAVELTVGGRLKGMIGAVAGQARRSRAVGADDALSGI